MKDLIRANNLGPTKTIFKPHVKQPLVIVAAKSSSNKLEVDSIVNNFAFCLNIIQFKKN